VQFEHLNRKWSACSAIEQLTALASCAYPTIALGRALLVERDAKRMKANLERLLRTRHGTVEARGYAESLLDQVRSVAGQIQVWLRDRPYTALNCPCEVNTEVPAWTAAELLAFLKPFYPLAQEITDPNRLIRLVFRSIRRVPNPNFRSRFKQSPDEAAEYFFDRTDALLYAAQKWGGFECCFQSALAASHLGLLRDARFIFPLLTMNRFEDRLTGVACLAFLQTTGTVKRLRTVAFEDPSPAVRGAALWACGFTQMESLDEVLASRQQDDPDVHIREFSAKAQHIKALDWWTLQV
jgi:hypothetical protein